MALERRLVSSLSVVCYRSFAACSTATLAAMILPWLFDAFASIPAFGSGPLATVIQDLLSIWIDPSVTTFVMS